MIICFTVQIAAWFMGMVIPFFIMTETYINTFVGFEDVYKGMSDVIIGPMFAVYLCTIVSFGAYKSFVPIAKII